MRSLPRTVRAERSSNRILPWLVLAFGLGLLLGGMLEKIHVLSLLHQSIAGKPLATSTPTAIGTDRVLAPNSEIRNKRLMVALILGQSNSANYGETRYTPTQHVFNFYDGRLYLARDPLLGADGEGGSIWTRLGEKLVDGGFYDAVVLIPIGQGATDIGRWAPGGDLHDRILTVIDEARKQGLAITHVLWQQGEADAVLGTNTEEYKRHFLEMLLSIRRRHVTAPIYVAVSTRCQKERGSPSIQRAQRELIDPALGIRAGPDTDSLGFAYRFDGCHFSAEGLEEAAALWLQALESGVTSTMP